MGIAVLALDLHMALLRLRVACDILLVNSIVLCTLWSNGTTRISSSAGPHVHLHWGGFQMTTAVNLSFPFGDMSLPFGVKVIKMVSERNPVIRHRICVPLFKNF